MRSIIQFLAIAFLLFFTKEIFSQTIFQKTYGGAWYDVGYSVQQTFDGGYIIAGNKSNVGTSETDIFLAKTNYSGDTLWTKIFGGANSEWTYAVRQTADSGFIVIGSTISFGSGNHDIFLLKTDLTGNLLWSKTFGGPGLDMGHSIQQTADGGYILTGIYDSGSGSVSFLIKTNASGYPDWTQFFQGLYGASVQQTTDGGYILAGRTIGDISLVKTDSAGNVIWLKTFGGTYDDRAQTVEQTTDGGYVIGGHIYWSSFGVHYVYLIKTDANGDTLWTQAYQSNGDYNGFSVTQTSDGGYIATGYIDTAFTFFRQAHLLKTDSVGIPQWSKVYGGQDNSIGFSVRQTTDGGYIITGSNIGLSGISSVYLIKTDSAGNSGCNETNLTTSIIAYTTQVSGNGSVTIPPAIPISSPSLVLGGGCIITTFCTTVEIQDAFNEQFDAITINPNPSSGYFVIAFNNLISKGNVEILNILGEDIFTENIFNESKKEINLKNISAGIYFVKVFDGEKSYCRKLIIEHN